MIKLERIIDFVVEKLHPIYLIKVLTCEVRGWEALQFGHCIVFLDKKLFFHSASLHPDYKWIPANCQGSLIKCWVVIL